ncbi:hypothetical protein C8J57DRAFT_183359 [Mycena rebaudengoi]|nr:hypothetical protein C8J57DRAFT_183359 [Mycena rebaudengoi]
MRAYRAYNNPVFLQFSRQSWLVGRSYTLSESDVSAGKMAGKDLRLADTCNRASLIGGTFVTSNSSDPKLGGLSTAYFLVLSALLAEATNDTAYSTAAVQSAGFLDVHLSDTQHLVHDSISARASDACALEPSTDSSNAGLTIEGLSVLSSITRNATTQGRLNDVIKSVISNTAFQTPEGIIIRGDSKLGDHHLVRGLAAAYQRDLIVPHLLNHVRDYLGVQFNAVSDLATINGSNIYAGAWTGPPSSEFSLFNQTTALGALISAIVVESDSTFAADSSPSGSPPPPPSPKPSRGAPVAAIVGGTVGGTILFSLAAAIWLIGRRRSRISPSNVQGAAQIQTRGLRPPSPFLTTSPLTTRTPTKPDLPSIQHIIGASAQTNVIISPTDGSDPSANSPAGLPTVDLVRLLNARLQSGHWDEEESPPQYAATM